MRALVLLLLALTGCTAGRSLYYVWSAERSVTEAVEAGADTKAVYEYTLAREYLKKAKEETGYSDYKDAERLARKAETWSVKAAEVAQYGSTERELMLREAGEVVPDEVTPTEFNPLVPLDEGEEEG